jgi:uncharacterized protein
MDATATAGSVLPRLARAARERRPRRPWSRGLLAAALAIFTLLFALPTLDTREALAAFTPPPLNGHVVDTAGKLTDADIRYLDQKLDRLRRKTGFAIVAFVVGSLEGETIDDVAYKAFNAWEIGEKGRDNGVLLVIAPSDRKVRIETGKGVGGALTDLQSNDIIRGRINPLLQQDRFREAVDQGTTAIARTLVKGSPEDKPSAPPSARERPSLMNTLMLIGLGILVIILAIVSPTFRHILFFFLLFGRGGGGGGGGGSGYGGGGGRSGGGGSSDSY